MNLKVSGCRECPLLERRDIDDWLHEYYCNATGRRMLAPREDEPPPDGCPAREGLTINFVPASALMKIVRGKIRDSHFTPDTLYTNGTLQAAPNRGVTRRRGYQEEEDPGYGYWDALDCWSRYFADEF